MKNTNAKIIGQSGVVLVTSLIMLMLLTLIGIAGIQNTSLEEKMASNSRDQNIAFQAAEAALRQGELLIKNATSAQKVNFTTDPINANGLHLLNEDLDHKAAATWGAEESVEHTTSFPSLAAEPRYYIEYAKDISHDINISNNPKPPTSYLIITARGKGAQDTSQVYLRSSFAKKF